MKVHLIRTELPLVPGKDQTADCGKLITKAYFPQTLDLAIMSKSIALEPNVCKKCWKKDVTARYWYWAVDGQESRLGQPE